MMDGGHRPVVCAVLLILHALLCEEGTRVVPGFGRIYSRKHFLFFFFIPAIGYDPKELAPRL